MSKTQWEYNMVEPPFCEQLKAMRWQWINGDKDAADFTKLFNFRRGLLKARLATTRRKLNLRAGQTSNACATPSHLTEATSGPFPLYKFNKYQRRNENALFPPV